LITLLLDRGVSTLRGALAGAENRAIAVDAGMDAREAFLGGEAGEIAAMVLHPRAEAIPEGESVRLGHGRAVDEDTELSLRTLVHELTSASTSLACFDTSTSR